MQSKYSIIIPVYNEINTLLELIQSLQKYYKNGHEIIIVDDGSNDGSYELTKKYEFIQIIKLDSNQGKGEALKIGINSALNDKLIIFDGDLELNPKEIQKLMILDKKAGSNCTFAYRTGMSFFSPWTIGNRVLTFVFNFIHKSDIHDALCCAKSFYKTDIITSNLKASGFDIDVEIASILVSVYKDVTNVSIDYNRRTMKQGKKLKLKDTFIILKKILTFFNK